MISTRKIAIFESIILVVLWCAGLSRGIGCSACVQREEVRQFTIQNIKNEILRKLRMENAPNVTVDSIKKSQVVRHLIHKIERGNGMMGDQPEAAQHEDLFQPNHVTVLPSQGSSKAVLEHHHWNTLYYKLSESLVEEGNYLESAHLLLHLPAAPSHSHSHAHVKVFYVGIDKRTGKPTQFKETEGTWELRPHRGGLVKIDIIHLVRNWVNNPSENLGLVVRAVTSKGMELEVPAWHTATAPYLQINLRPKPSHLRKKRNANMECTEERDANVTECCRWPLTIDFRKFGWDWILEPKTYEANLCAGDCSLGVVGDSPHTHMLQMNLLNSAGPCCSPKQMSHISIVYVTEDRQVVAGLLPGMKVEQCGCA